MSEYFISLFFGTLALGVLLLVICGLVSGYQAISDSLVCKAQTGLYNGCTLKQHEETYNIKVKNEAK